MIISCFLVGWLLSAFDGSVDLHLVLLGFFDLVHFMLVFGLFDELLFRRWEMGNKWLLMLFLGCFFPYLEVTLLVGVFRC